MRSSPNKWRYHAIYEKGCNQIIGIDISPVSIAYAKKRYPDIMFLCDDICSANKVAQYDLALAVMVLNNMPDVRSFFNSISRLLVVGGTLIIVLPHPCFWPQQHLLCIELMYMPTREKTQ